MRAVIGLHDGRSVEGDAAQITLMVGGETPVMLAFVGGAGEILASHCRESSWGQFLTDAGISGLVLPGNAENRTLRARVIGEDGKVVQVPCVSAIAYSDLGDPVIAALPTKANIDFCHCGEDRWKKFCKHHDLFIPREVEVTEAQ